MNVFVILGVLFVALFILIPLLEKSNMRVSEETTAKLSRWIWPLMGVVLIASMIKMFMS